MPLQALDDAKSARQMRVSSALVLICGVILCFDVGGELHSFALFGDRFSGVALFHLGTEIAATLGLLAAFLVIRAEMRRIARRHSADRSRMRALRGDFDHVLHSQFQTWGLSPAESDVALLTMRGLKIAEIATMRGAQQGTIKSQLSTIFRKSGTSTRTEFVARFIDLFLDHAMADTHRYGVMTRPS